MLRRTNRNSNYFTFNIIAYSYKRELLLEGDYTFIISSKVKPIKESKTMRKERFKRLMKENNWTKAELSRELNISRAWVTMTLR